MRINEGIAIQTTPVLLVPYEAHHVARYHSWMQDPVSPPPQSRRCFSDSTGNSETDEPAKAIREATASEELSLQEEFENQQSWRRAHDKLTFILCTPPPTLPPLVTAGREDAEDRMIGDVNFFLYPHDEGEEGGEHGSGNGQDDGGETLNRTGDQTEILVRGEVDIMVAEAEARGKGAGSAAVRALLAFVARHMASLLEEYAAGERGRGGAAAARDQRVKDERAGAERRMRLVELMVKIKEGNADSIRLFGALGFAQEGAVDYFGEVRMVLPWELAQRASGDDAERLAYQELVYAAGL